MNPLNCFLQDQISMVFIGFRYKPSPRLSLGIPLPSISEPFVAGMPSMQARATRCRTAMGKALRLARAPASATTKGYRVMRCPACLGTDTRMI